MTFPRFSLRAAMLGIAGLALLLAAVSLLCSRFGIRGATWRIQGAELRVDVALDPDQSVNPGTGLIVISHDVLVQIPLLSARSSWRPFARSSQGLPPSDVTDED